MLRVYFAILFTMTSAAASASAAGPASAPAPGASSQPSISPEELHRQALDMKRAGRIDAASAVMDKAYNATPADQRTRPLVLNRAIIDLTARVNVMRAVRDLQQYFREHPQPDEQAENILGAALNVAAETPRWKKGTLWQSAYQEWDRRNTQLQDIRPGYHRWGTQWLEEKQYLQMEADRVEMQRAIDEQTANVDRAKTRLAAARARGEMLRLSSDELRQQMQQQGSNRTGGALLPPGQQGNVGVPVGQSVTGALAGTNEARGRAVADTVIANAEFQAEQTRLNQLKSSLAGVRPQWPATFDPIELTALTPPPPPPPDAKAMAAIVETAAKEKARVNSPFSASGTAQKLANDPGPAAAQPPGPAAPAAPTTGPAPQPPPESPFAPRDIDKHPRR
jgi:hypothetical protein